MLATPEDVRVYLALVDREHAAVVRFLVWCGCPPQDSTDAAQEAFLEAWRLMAMRPDKWAKVASPERWLRSVALRKWKRPPGPRHRVPETPVAEFPEQPVVTEHDSAFTIVWRALQSQDETTRIVWSLTRDGFSRKEIGELLGISEQRVTDILKKVRRAVERVAQAIVGERAVL